MELLGGATRRSCGSIRFAQRVRERRLPAYRGALDDGPGLRRAAARAARAGRLRGDDRARRPGAVAGRAFLELLAALCARPAGRQGLRAARVGRGSWWRRCSARATISRRRTCGRSTCAGGGAERPGDGGGAAARSATTWTRRPTRSFVPDAPDPSLAMTRHVRAAFVAL